MLHYWAEFLGEQKPRIMVKYWERSWRSSAWLCQLDEEKQPTSHCWPPWSRAKPSILPETLDMSASLSSPPDKLLSICADTTLTHRRYTGGNKSTSRLVLSSRNWWTFFSRTDLRCATPTLSPSWTLASRGTSLTSQWSPTASAPPPSWPLSRLSRTTWTRAWSAWTKFPPVMSISPHLIPNSNSWRRDDQPI